MQKTIRIFAIAAAALGAVSMLLLLVTLPFQQILAKEIFASPDIILSYLPQFPLAAFLAALLKAGCMGLLIICCGNKKGGIWLEILVFAALVFVVPALTEWISLFYQNYAGVLGEAYLAAYSVAGKMANYCLKPVELGQAVAFVAVGMSIVFKFMSQKPAAVEVTEK